jgi:hypothetical protein
VRCIHVLSRQAESRHLGLTRAATSHPSETARDSSTSLGITAIFFVIRH